MAKMESSKGFETASKDSCFHLVLLLITTSHLKKASNVQLRCCEPLQNAHILRRMPRFFIGLRLVLERDLNF
jgi:hypothetical protein